MPLDDINAAIIGCTRCPRLRAYCTAIAQAKKPEFRNWDYWGLPIPGFGDPEALLLIVGLAPAAHGANRTGRMFTGDSSGNWLFAALYRSGFASQPTSTSREDGLRLRGCYIAAAARCAPPDNRPTPEELGHCRPYLEAEIERLRKIRVVIVLGRIAWESWLRAAGWWARLPPRDRPPFGHAREWTAPDGTVLLSSYHPSRQNTNTGRLTVEMWNAVFDRAKELIER
ncbi:MAG: uracil-DNA glycosylase [Gemmatimonadota bacterium]